MNLQSCVDYYDHVVAEQFIMSGLIEYYVQGETKPYLKGVIKDGRRLGLHYTPDSQRDKVHIKIRVATLSLITLLNSK